jgi:hypothetical protein
MLGDDTRGYGSSRMAMLRQRQNPPGCHRVVPP